MNILTFDIMGIYAHFRKIYTNSSSLSYYFPPPTTVAGIAAAILGRERDSYYEEFVPDNYRVGIRILKPLRKMTHTLNYMMVKGTRDLYFRQSPTQIPFEILAGEEDNVAYKIYLWHRDESVISELSRRITNGRFAFPPYLGVAPFSCHVTGGEILQVEEKESDSIVSIHSVINVQHIVKDSVDVTHGLTRVIKDIIPLYFNADRVPQKTVGVIFDEKCQSIELSLNTSFFSNGDENIVFI